MQQGTLNSITITIFLKNHPLSKNHLLRRDGKKRQWSKKLSLDQTAACGSTPSWTLVFPAHWGFTVFTPCPVSYCICHPAGLPAGKSTLGVLVAVLPVGSQSILHPSLVL